MLDLKAKMHQIQLRLGLRPRLHWRSVQRSPDPLAGYKGGKGREGRRREERGRQGRGWRTP